MVARSDFVRKNPQIAKALVDVLNSTRKWVIAHPQESQEIVSAELKLPLAVVQRAWKRQDWSSSLDQKLCNDMQKKADFLKTIGLVRNRVDVNTLVQSTIK